MNNLLTEGIPLERDYRALIESNEFKEMEKFSDNFLTNNKTVLKDYMNKWVKDPLHQWSRQWEYPYVYTKIQQIIKDDQSYNILDAGSGITFFSYYLKSQIERTSIHCCDYDKTLSDKYEQVNIGQSDSIVFASADLRDLPYQTGTFDVVYCISVLEHTSNYEQIITEFYRILKPGGKLIVTFDISLNGMSDISVNEGTLLLTSLAKHFHIDQSTSLDLVSQVSTPGIFTTLTAKDINKDLLPWKNPSILTQIKSTLKDWHVYSWPPPFTVFCIYLTKS